VIFIKSKIKFKGGYTLLELLISIIIISIIMVSVSSIYITMTTGFFQSSDKIEALQEKQRVINLFKKDMVYKTQIEILNSGADLKLIQPNLTEITYSFIEDKLTRNGVEMLNGLSEGKFQLKTSIDTRNNYIELRGELAGKTNKTKIDFNYVFEVLDNKWEFNYNYPDA